MVDTHHQTQPTSSPAAACHRGPPPTAPACATYLPALGWQLSQHILLQSPYHDTAHLHMRFDRTAAPNRHITPGKRHQHTSKTQPQLEHGPYRASWCLSPSPAGRAAPPAGPLLHCSSAGGGLPQARGQRAHSSQAPAGGHSTCGQMHAVHPKHVRIEACAGLLS